MCRSCRDAVVALESQRARGPSAGSARPPTRTSRPAAPLTTPHLPTMPQASKHSPKNRLPNDPPPAPPTHTPYRKPTRPWPCTWRRHPSQQKVSQSPSSPHANHTVGFGHKLLQGTQPQDPPHICSPRPLLSPQFPGHPRAPPPRRTGTTAPSMSAPPSTTLILPSTSFSTYINATDKQGCRIWQRGGFPPLPYRLTLFLPDTV